MAASNQLTEARRWVKFPATVLLAIALLWLLQNLFEFNSAEIGQRTEKVIGILYVIVDYIVVPLGSVAVGIGLLFLQRWALITGFFLPLLPLVLVTADKIGRVVAKFTQYRETGDFSHFGGGVMTALLVIALWAVFFLYLDYIYKSWRLTNQAREWLSPKRRGARGSAPGAEPPSGGAARTDDEGCYLLPDADDEEQS